jgi:hypothetical protein
MIVPLSAEIEYMMARCLPLLLTDATHRLHSAAKTPAVVGMRLSTAASSGLRVHESVFNLIHAVRVVSIALRQVIPACDRDLPFSLKQRHHLAPLALEGRIDLPRTVGSGAIATGRAMHTEQVLDFDTPELRRVVVALYHVYHDAYSVLAAIDPELQRFNPLIQELTKGLLRDLAELKLAIYRRPELHSSLRASQRVRTSRVTRRRRGWHRSLLNADRLSKYRQRNTTVAVAGNDIRTAIAVTSDKLYEFWCFCEFTNRLLMLNKFNVVQRSLLRTGLDKPVFAFGSDNYVYYEHRRNYFRLDDGSTIALRRARPGRGPEWFILRGGSPTDSIVVDCKYYGKARAGMFDPITTYCQDYGAQTGVGFAACEPPSRLTRRPGLREVEKRVDHYRLGDSSFRQFDVYLVPHPSRESLNSDVLDHLIDSLGL